MFHHIPKWSVFFWNIFSVMGVEHNNWQVIYSTLLIATCIVNVYYTPTIICVLDNQCDDSVSSVIKGMFVRVVAVTGLISRVVLLFKGKINLVKYKENMDTFHTFTPMTPSDIEGLNRVSTKVILCCILLTVPINFARVWIIWDLVQSTIVFVTLVYIQNFSMYSIETHYTVLCFILYQKFAGINKDLLTLKINTVMRNKYPFMSKTGEKYLKNNSTIDCNKEILYSLAAGCPMSDIVENLKIKHKLCCEAIIHLNNLFGIQLGLSLCALCLYTMFDLYYHLVGILEHSKSNALIYGWILQYSIRFVIVTVLPHATTKQALKSKILVTDINNRYLDNGTKEELQMFLNQISSCTITFTACDFFTLNNHMITSAIAAGTTYLIILLQFNASGS